MAGVGVAATGFEAERQELSRRSHPQRGEDGTKPFKPAKDFGPSHGNKQGFLEEAGEATRRTEGKKQICALGRPRDYIKRGHAWRHR